MAEKMKILIAYDGSDSANTMLAELAQTGLPQQADTTVISVAELTFPPPPIYQSIEDDLTPGFPFDLVATERLAAKAAERVRRIFPEWDVTAEACAGSPAQEIIMRSDELKPDLILIGSQGLSAVNRFIFGSVSQKVVTEAYCSVQVTRAHQQSKHAPNRILIGVDGSPESTAAVNQVTARYWPADTEVILFTAVDKGMMLDLSYDRVSGGAAARAVRKVEPEIITERKVAELQRALADRLQTAGLTVRLIVKEGDPKRLLVAEAESWQVNNIFLGSRGLGRIKRFLLGSVSTAVVARAHCSVTVVRKQR